MNKQTGRVISSSAKQDIKWGNGSYEREDPVSGIWRLLWRGLKEGNVSYILNGEAELWRSTCKGPEVRNEPSVSKNKRQPLWLEPSG